MNASSLYDDAELYDLHHGGYRDDFGFYRRLVEDHGGPVLELGAGTGRLTITLARTGARVVAVEPSAAMRERALRRVELEGLADLVDVVDGDARTLDLPLRAALVVAPFNTLMHLERIDEQDTALERARAHLVPGGAFACDLYVPRFEPDGIVRAERPAAGLGVDGDLMLWHEHDPAAQVMTTHFRLFAAGADGRLQRRSATLRQRYYHRFELERALAAAGLGELRLYGDFERGPFTASSPVMAVVARARRTGRAA